MNSFLRRVELEPPKPWQPVVVANGQERPAVRLKGKAAPTRIFLPVAHCSERVQRKISDYSLQFRKEVATCVHHAFRALLAPGS